MSAARPNASLFETAEGSRLRNAAQGGWRRWGPYLSERQWGTVREDYSADSDAWAYLPHDHARSRAYRWGEDGIAGFCDEEQRWCLSLALWNGADPILKERLFGLANAEGNHGEDVKELWWHLDATPTHSYQSMLYRYPQRAFPYDDLLSENQRRKARSSSEPEYELEDTGVFEGGRWFDATVEYAKAGPDDILMRITVENHGPETASLHVLPQLVARNIWSWEANAPRPSLALEEGRVAMRHPDLPDMRFEALQPADWLFCENDTNARRLFDWGDEGAFKDAINDAVTGARSAPLPDQGTKCAAVTNAALAPGERLVLRYRLAPVDAGPIDIAGFDALMAARIQEAEAFYGALQRDIDDADARLVQRRALAGLLWSKQVYRYDVKRWLEGDPAQPTPPSARLSGRNADWTHLSNAEVVLMPDTWEYPWYASWDLAFHAITLAMIDPELAKHQLLLLSRESYMHPSGQFPAYEWSFGDANPPIQAFATLRVYRTDAALSGKPDRKFLTRTFHKLLINFTWWVNRKDLRDRNLFQGGFLGLDNIELFDRSEPVPGGGYIDQSDGTAWMSMYALNMMRIALELALEDEAYEDIAVKFYEHFLLIASAMTHVGCGEARKDTEGRGLWDEEDGFFYDALVLPDGTETTLRVRSLVGLIPLCAVEVLEQGLAARHPHFAHRIAILRKNRPDLAEQVSSVGATGEDDRVLLSLLRHHRMEALLTRMLDETEFLSPFGVRSLSKVHQDHPFVLDRNGTRFCVDYEPGSSTSLIFGGNSNWRGPVWMPINFMLIEALREFDRFYGETFRVECPTGSGIMRSIGQVADELSQRLCRLFLEDDGGERPALATTRFGAGRTELVQFHEFFHGETGAGLGASHQTGWTALVALLIMALPSTNAPA